MLGFAHSGTKNQCVTACRRGLIRAFLAACGAHDQDVHYLIVTVTEPQLSDVSRSQGTSEAQTAKVK